MGRRISEIAYAVVEVQGRSGNGSAVRMAYIERPPGLAQPRPDIGFELGVIFFGDSPTLHISIEIAFHRK
jgi:hypothetical protein